MIYDDYGGVTGASQIAPGRDVQHARTRRRPGRPPKPDIATAVNGGIVSPAHPMTRPAVTPPWSGGRGTRPGAGVGVPAPQSAAGSAPGLQTDVDKWGRSPGDPLYGRPPQGTFEGPTTSGGTTPTGTAPTVPSALDPAKKEALRQLLLRNGFGGGLDAERGGGLKLDSAEHAKKSPKYAFAQKALELGLEGKVGDLPTLLAALQQSDPRFAGWKIGGGKGDKLTYAGESLDPSFNGVSTIDAILAAGEGGKGFWWGAEDPMGGAGAAGGGVNPSAILGLPNMGGTAPTVGDFTNDRQRQIIIQALQSAGLGDFLSMYGYK